MCRNLMIRDHSLFLPGEGAVEYGVVHDFFDGLKGVAITFWWAERGVISFLFSHFQKRFFCAFNTSAVKEVPINPKN